jgi:multiple sugar transport system substrate-binding protein
MEQPDRTRLAVGGLVVLVLAVFSVRWFFVEETPALRIANWAGPEGIAIEERILDPFRTRHPDLNIVLEPIPRDYLQKILISFAGGTGPDVFLVDAIHLAKLSEAGVLRDLEPYCRNHAYSLDGFVPAALEIYEEDGRLWAIPKDFTPILILYNRAMFDEAGAEYPEAGWTWEDFRRLSRKLTDRNGPAERYGTVIYPDFWAWPPWVWSAGGGFLSKDGTQATGSLDGPGTVSALQFLLDLHLKDGTAAGIELIHSLGGDVAGFSSGRIGMAVGGHWWLAQLLEPVRSGKLHVGAVPIPVPKAGGERVTVLYSSGWAVSSTTRYPDRAFELAAYLSGIPANRLRMGQRIALPANRTLLEELVGQDETGLEAAFANEVRYARVPEGARYESMDAVRRRAEEAFANALLRKTPIEKELRRAAKDIDLLLRRERR